MPVDRSGFFDHTAQSMGADFRREAITMLEAMGISVEFSHHEGGPGQQEIDLRYADALSTADNIMTFRTVIREVALSQGIWATFMPKPFTSHPGSGMHTHVSLFEGDQNAFYEAGSEYQLSKTGRQFIAGVLAHAQEISVVTNQWVNSYKRMMFGGEAPSYVCWGHNNRCAMIRVPMYKPLKGQSTRIELRTVDAACNPYLAFAVTLAAGMKGIEQGLDLPREAEDDVWSLTERERTSLGIEPLPKSLNEAIEIAERSELLAETLGEHVFDFFLRNKRARVGRVPRPGLRLRAGPHAPGPLRRRDGRLQPRPGQPAALGARHRDRGRGAHRAVRGVHPGRPASTGRQGCWRWCVGRAAARGRGLPRSGCSVTPGAPAKIATIVTAVLCLLSGLALAGSWLAFLLPLMGLGLLFLALISRRGGVVEPSHPGRAARGRRPGAPVRATGSRRPAAPSRSSIRTPATPCPPWTATPACWSWAARWAPTTTRCSTGSVRSRS